MIPWLTRLPTADEVRAHARSHRVNIDRRTEWTPSDNPDGWGMWLANDGDPFLTLLLADVDSVWLPDGDMLTERRCPGAKWLPCTAEGIPVCLLPKKPEASTIGDLIREGMRGKVGTA